jgi:hypothetical protein
MKKKILIITLVSVLICLTGIVVLWSLLPKQFPIMPSDDELISNRFDQKLPGFANITLLDRQGKGDGDDPRVLTLRVSMDTGRRPVLCEGKLMFFISDPSYLNFTWNKLDCSGQELLVRLAQLALQGERNYTCHQDKIASLLAYWVQNNSISIDKIVDLNLHSLVKKSLEENKQIPDQIRLLDLSLMRTKDFDPSLPDEQKIAQYVLRCDGTIEQYLAKENSTIYSQVPLDDGTYLDPPPFEKP